MPKVSFSTLGCRLNQAESDSMLEQLAAHGFTPAPPGEQAELVVVNTCTVTREATKASRMAIRRAAKANPNAKVVAIGCYVASDRAEVEAMDDVDIALDNSAKDRLVDALGSGVVPQSPLLQIRGLGGAIAFDQPKVRANLKVQTGCDEWCSFCIIPKTRGPLHSYDEDSLVTQARARVESGAREIVLTGVHLGKYDYDRGGDERNLLRLFQRLLGIDGLERLRLSSILSRHLTPEVVAFMAAEPRICRYLHVPLQSGDDEILEAMNRPYRIDDYIESVERARSLLPGLALATDIIVGFPGESEDAFVATLRVVERLQFSKLHAFRYSARPDTAAASMPGEVPAEVKRDRSKRLIELGNRIRTRFLEDHLDRPLQVLVEDEREIDGAWISSGQTDDYVRVWFEAQGLLGQTVDVQGSSVRADGIDGRLIAAEVSA